jgi:voltage-gated potassium channel
MKAFKPAMRRSHHNGKKFCFLASALGIEYIAAAAIYSICEHHSFGDALWWAFMTFTTVGYGDQYPTTMAGRAAGIVLVSSAVFVIMPTITALIATRLLHDRNEFTHEEQEEIKTLLHAIHNQVTK